jgi:hypothetical protein
MIVREQVTTLGKKGAASGSSYPLHAAGTMILVKEKVYEVMGTLDAPV